MHVFSVYLEFCIRFLKTNMVNQFVCASHLGHNSDYEGVRLYTGKGELVARILVDKGLATMADSYSFPKASSLPAILPINPEPEDYGREPPPKKPCIMKETKALGIGPTG